MLEKIVKNTKKPEQIIQCYRDKNTGSAKNEAKA